MQLPGTTFGPAKEQPAEPVSGPTNEQLTDLMRGHKIATRLELDVTQRLLLEIGRVLNVISSRLGWLLAIVLIIIALQILASCGSLLSLR